MRLAERPPKIAYVVWVDASYGVGGEYPIEGTKLSRLHEVGFILREDEDTLVLGLEWQPGSETSRNWLAIPKIGIVARKDITLPAISRKAYTRL